MFFPLLKDLTNEQWKICCSWVAFSSIGYRWGVKNKTCCKHVFIVVNLSPGGFQWIECAHYLHFWVSRSFFQIVTEFFWLVGIQEMGIPEAINHAIEQLPVGTWFCTECCGWTMQSSSKAAFTPMLLQNHLVLNCFHNGMLCYIIITN